jgi:hypothetical protein
MGLFDEVHFRGNVYQTKDFDNEMLNYYIGDDNRLIKDIGHTEHVPKEQRPYPNAPEGSIDSFCGCVRWVSTGKEDTNYHGMLYIYRSLGKDKGWENLKLKFTDGNLVDCIEVPDD